MTSAHDTFAPALQSFATDVFAKFALPVSFQPEDQLKGPVAALLKQAGNALSGMAVDVVTEVKVDALGGRPDMGVTVKGLLAGYVELKAPGKGANPDQLKGDDKLQWGKFKNLPNLVYTDGNEWALYRNGERVGKFIRLAGDITKDGAAAASRDDAVALIGLMCDFLGWQPITPATPRALAEMLAPLCRLLRTDVLTALQDPDSNLAALLQDWRNFFFPDADKNQFADAYAQTLTYALLLARLSGASDLSVPQASQSLRTGHRLLADVLRRLGENEAREEIKVSADLLERVIEAIDPAVFRKNAGSDPWLYFYEDFLAAYDPKMRNDRGVYYTPVEVVQCQVRLVAELLADHFGADFSFVDENVVTLDPTTGTGTYILAAVQHGLDQIAAIKGPGAKVSAASTAAKNVHAFELLVGPYAVAHLRLTQQIVAENAGLPEDGVHIYLTDTLESPNATPKDYLPLPYRQLAEEHRRALKVKKDTRVLVCIGNPPYDRQTIDPANQDNEQRKGGWVRFGDTTQEKDKRTLMDDFLDPLSAAGLGLHAKNLYNDYVYFWRWALWKVFEQQAGPGIVSFITAASYLRGPGFAGMRKVMRQAFDELWLIDLEGDNLGARKSENVFAIRTPVAIAVGVRYGTPKPDTPATVRYTRISGIQQEKLTALQEIEHFSSLQWRTCFTDWMKPFLPAGDTPYWQWPLLTDLFPWQANGMQFKRSWPIGETREVLERRWAKLLATKDRRTAFKESRDRVVGKQYPTLTDPGIKATSIANLDSNSPLPQVSRIAYRSFDRHWALVDHRLGDYLRPSLHQTYGEHQIYVTSLLTKVLGEGPAAVATALIPDMDHFSNRGAKDVIPLWCDATGTEPNITGGILDALKTVYDQQVAPDDFFAYCYALLATPRYVKTFWDELTIPGPRVPITKDHALFSQAAALGRKLIWLHTYGERFVPTGKKAGRVPSGKARIKVGTPTSAAEYPETFKYDPLKQELHVGKCGLFSDVRPEVWNFSVSGLEVVKSWLAYRMRKRAGKSSSPLDEIRPDGWQFDGELLDLLWVLDATVDLLPEATALLDQVLAGDLFVASDFPVPTDAERRGPVATSSGELPLFDAAEVEVEDTNGEGGEDDL
jgi:hypothetical protein